MFVPLMFYSEDRTEVSLSRDGKPLYFTQEEALEHTIKQYIGTRSTLENHLIEIVSVHLVPSKVKGKGTIFALWRRQRISFSPEIETQEGE